MKLIGKEAQKKIDIQIQSLQEQVENLQQTLRSNEFVVLGATHELAELKPQYAQLLDTKDALEQKLAEQTSEMQALQSQLQSQQAKLQALQAQLNTSEAAVSASKAEADKLKNDQSANSRQLQDQIDKLNQALAASQKAHKDSESLLNASKSETDKARASELAVSQQLKEQTDKLNQELAISQKAVKDAQALVTASKAEADKLKANQTTSHLQLQEQLNKLTQDLEANQKKQKSTEEALSAAKAHAEQLTKAKTEAEQLSHQSLAQSKAESDALRQEKSKLAAEKDDLANKLAKLQSMPKMDEATQKALLDAKSQLETKTKELTTTQAERDKLSKQVKQASAKYEDSHQENELLLLQLMQAQEELVEYYEEKGRFEQLYEAYKNRWTRLEERHPNYVDFGSVELLAFDSVSEVPSITWRVKDYAQAGLVLPEFLFQTVLQQGQPGIGLVADEQALAKDDSALVPKLISTSTVQVEKFLRLSTTDFRHLTAGASILAQLETTQWQGIDVPAGFDPNFWRPSLKLLSTQLLALPAVLRYDAVKLKRELINPDYEHLWIELHGMTHGGRTWKKFETRLGAALVQDGGFSQFPKFEIPLIDGKHKPFDSWYAESQDDSGAKLELRFSIEKNIFDAAVFAKLSEADRLLLVRLIYAFPEVLKRLEAQHASIHRPWATWIDFAAKSIAVLELQKQATNPLPTAKQNAQTTDAGGEPPSAQAQDAVRRIQTNRPSGPKVISVGSKAPGAAPAKRPASKSKP
ncbi:hypothetical protein B9Z51_01735 [Limnohabitans sp. T6-5]|uniref:hypothetical protein n=1 Tax=Limnohabitans sp. T6-5 TaxID=1100724 RepID=UPI000D3BC332|nr:hypothetical protein [Limnohabitans sp. T6-5]PUE11073.1 hypothetical protein B9Z51_01735 [Limnohabitans sp. T6-5]